MSTDRHGTDPDHRAPSDAASLDHLRTIQNLEHLEAMFNTRPVTLEPPPLAPYFPAFATFINETSPGYHDQLPFTSDELVAAKDVVCCSAELYVAESDRVAALYRTALFKDGHSLEAKPPLSLDSIHVGISRMSSCPALRSGNAVTSEFAEVKNEIGIGDSDPLVQVERYYVSTYKSTAVRLACCSET